MSIRLKLNLNLIASQVPWLLNFKFVGYVKLSFEFTDVFLLFVQHYGQLLCLAVLIITN